MIEGAKSASGVMVRQTPLGGRHMKLFATFTDEEIVLTLSPKMIVDAIWEAEYGQSIPPNVREVPLALMYLVKKYDGLVPQWLLRRTVAQNLEVSEDTAGELIEAAEGAEDDDNGEGKKPALITAITPDGDTRQRLYGFTEKQKEQILVAGRAEAYAAALAMEQAKVPTNPEAGKNEQTAKYYRTILTRLQNKSGSEYEDIMKRLKKIRHLLSILMAFAIAVAISVLPWAEAIAATWSTGTT